MAAVPPGERVGLKSLETRKARIAPGPLGAWPTIEPVGMALALVVIGESRPLLPEDEPAAWFYAPDRKAMAIERCWPFKRPFKQRGIPGEFKVEREQVLEALAG